MIHHVCPECQYPVDLADEFAGRTIRCPSCQSLLAVPSTGVTEMSSPTAPSSEAALVPPEPAVLPDSGKLAAGRKALGDLNRLIGERARPLESINAAFKPPQPPNPAKRILLLCGIPLAVCVGAWLLPGGVYWYVGGGFATLLGGCILLLVFGQRKPLRLARIDLLALLAYFAMLELVWWWGGLNVSQSDVYVDNFSTRTLRVERDGRDWLTCRSGTTAKQQLRRGRYHLVVRADGSGEVLDERDVYVEGLDRAFVLNLLSAQKYYRGSVQYGGIIGFGNPKPKEIRDAWFKPDVDFLFQDPPSSIEVSAPKGQPEFMSMETKTYLTRGTPPPER